MPVNYKKTRLSGRNNIAFYFNNLQDVQRFTNENLDKVTTTDPIFEVISRYRENIVDTVTSQILSGGTNWYGTLDTSWATQDINNFLNNQQLNTDLNRLNQNFARVDVIDISQKKKLEFTEKEIGIFSFDLASLGLIRVYQYFSTLLSDYVDNNLVQSYKNNEGDLIFYYVGTPYVPRHEVPFDLKKGYYYSEILKRRVDTSELVEVVPDNPNLPIQFFYPEKQEIPRHNVDRRQKTDIDGSKKFATTYKKCFIDIPKIKGKLPRIDLIVPVSYSASTSAQEIYWNTISVLLVAKKLTDSGINFRVLGFYGNDSQPTKLYTFVNLKDENQPLDINSLAISISDARFYRIADFKYSWAALIETNRRNEVRRGVGQSIIDISDIKRKYIEFLSLQTSQSDREAANNPNSKIMFPVAFSERQAINSYNSVIDQIKGQLVI